MEFAILILDYDCYYKLEIAGGYCDGNCSVCRKCTNNRNIVTLIREENAEFYQKYVLDHQTRTAELCKKVSKALSLDESEKRILIQSALLHDIGKLLINFKILSKDTSLLPFERRMMEFHPSKGAGWLKERDFPEEIVTIVETHHEKVDGSGYPYGLKGDEIPFLARILAVCDAADAMMSGRHYKAAVEKKFIIEELLRNSGSQFDPMVARTMIEIIHEEEMVNV
ncbi:HD-GYP domain-containing protein [Caldanaerobacter subterraneus]|uniref:Response regulator n=1 Tax=Caldanaerobacter subterraneus subsp. pacificus DSM 12653 TaxID=391606 RepID=B7R6E7_9THEO|nr:HD domain-containing phosphohydrolase [Caldanaerobacter subterraneus]KKC28803.1 response regulator [Caldanaerobacter subterraneus subsp. pacificus DSM 12653]